MSVPSTRISSSSPLLLIGSYIAGGKERVVAYGSFVMSTAQILFYLCKYKKSGTEPTLYRLHYSELLEYFTDYTHIFNDGSKDGDKTAAAFICQSFEF